MGILVITVDLDCCRCRAKITKVLDSLKEEFCIEKVEFEDKKEKKVVVVRGKFDPEKLCKKVWCKAGNKVVKEIIIVDVWPIPPKPPKPEDPKPEKCCCCEHCKPKPDKCCDCEHCKPKPKPEEPKPKPPEDKPKPPPAPKTQYKFVPYPYPLPPNAGMCQSWPWQCPPQLQCQCCEKPQPPPPPPPPCTCWSHGSHCGGCGQTPPFWPPQPPVWPPPWAGCNVVADENSCSVM